MKLAIISDVHSNLPALNAVLADIESQKVDRIYCLGDVVGYGPNPRECLDKIMQLDGCILGNHDQGALFDPVGFSSTAERAVFWTRQQLESPGINGDENQVSEESKRSQLARWTFLCELPRMRREEDSLFVHGSARNPVSEYVFPEDVYNQQKMTRIFALVPQFCFQGHTHVPGIFTAAGAFLRPDELKSGYRLGNQKLMINVGSVGQPRDGNPLSCYVIKDHDTIRFRRVGYPIEETVRQIHAIDDLDDFLGDRLLEGK